MAVRGSEQRRQAVQIRGQLWMVRPERRLVDRQGAAKQRLGLRMTVRVIEHPRQAVQTYGHVWMVRSERRFADRQGAAIQRLGASVFGTFLQEQGHTVQATCEARTGTGGRLVLVQCTGIVRDLVVRVAQLQPVAQQLVLLRVRTEFPEHLQVD